MLKLRRQFSGNSRQKKAVANRKKISILAFLNIFVLEYAILMKCGVEKLLSEMVFSLQVHYSNVKYVQPDFHLILHLILNIFFPTQNLYWSRKEVQMQHKIFTVQSFGACVDLYVPLAYRAMCTRTWLTLLRPSS